MLPKHHIILGDFLALVVYLIFPEIGLLGFLLIFLSSFLFDVDHYIVYVLKKKEFSLNKAYYYFEEKIHKKENWDYLLIFHNIEFFIFLFILALFFQFFLFLLIGLLFHFLLDLVEDITQDEFDDRNFSIIHQIISK